MKLTGLPNINADYALSALSISPHGIMISNAGFRQNVNDTQAGLRKTFSLDIAPSYIVEIKWEHLTRTELKDIQDLFLSPSKAFGQAKSFCWLNPYDHIVYAVVFVGGLSDQYRAHTPYDAEMGLKMRVLGVALNSPIDSTAPVVNLGADGTHDGYGTGTFTITAAMITEANLPAGGVKYRWNSGSNIVIPTALPYQVTIPEGAINQTLYVTATDSSGNQGADSITFVYVADDTDPIVNLGADTTHNGAGTETFTITTGMVIEDNLDIVKYHWDSDADTTITLPHDVTVPEADTDHTLYVTAIDKIGNQGVDSKVFTYVDPNSDTTAPVVNLGADTTHDGTETKFTITAEMVDEDNLATVKYHWDSDTDITITPPYEVTVPEADTDHTLYVTAIDESSNQGSDSKVFTYVEPVPDTDPPVINLGGHQYHDGTGTDTFTITADMIQDASPYTVQYGWNKEPDTDITIPGVVTAPPGPVTHMFFVKAVDSSNNETTVWIYFYYQA